ncbi:MAG: YaiI/YqxD family protein [Planctomycetota bacterium]
MLHIYLDADACPVKAETYKVAKRLGLKVTVVANSWLSVPERSTIKLVVVSDGFDAADDWIVEAVEPDDIVVTSDIPLAARCIKNGARVLGPKGKLFSEEQIGEALAKREILSELREQGVVTGGPAPFQPKDRSRYLQALDQVIQAIYKDHPQMR